MKNKTVLKYRLTIEGAIAFEPGDVESLVEAHTIYARHALAAKKLGRVTEKCSVKNVMEDSVTETAKPVRKMAEAEASED